MTISSQGKSAYLPSRLMSCAPRGKLFCETHRAPCHLSFTFWWCYLLWLVHLWWLHLNTCISLMFIIVLCLNLYNGWIQFLLPLLMNLCLWLDLESIIDSFIHLKKQLHLIFLLELNHFLFPWYIIACVPCKYGLTLQDTTSTNNMGLF